MKILKIKKKLNIFLINKYLNKKNLFILEQGSKINNKSSDKNFNVLRLTKSLTKNAFKLEAINPKSFKFPLSFKFFDKVESFNSCILQKSKKNLNYPVFFKINNIVFKNFTSNQLLTPLKINHMLVNTLSNIFTLFHLVNED